MPVRDERSGALLAPSLAATEMGVSTQTVRRLMYEGQLPYVKIGTAVRIRRADIDAYIDAHTVRANAAPRPVRAAAKKAGRSR